MIERTLVAGPDHVVRVRFSERSDGDFAIDSDPDELAEARNRLAEGPWTTLQQVHGANVVVVEEPGAQRGAAADACVSRCVGARMSVQTADCAPLVIASEGLVGLAHAGWRGIVAGVVTATSDLMGALGAKEQHALLGPCIAAADYEFGAADLDLVASVAGDCVRSSTPQGRSALDLAAAVRAQCADAGVASFSVVGPSHSTQTSNPSPFSTVPFSTSDPRWYSHRCRGENQRQATVAWLERR